MRISSAEHEFIKEYWQRNFPGSSVYLFGSRADETGKGGDIDLMVISHKTITISDKVNFLSVFMTRFGEQKVDLVAFTYQEDLPFKNVAISSAVQL